MRPFELHMRSLPSGAFAAAWFDDARRLWNDERLAAPTPLAGEWTPPNLQLHRPSEAATPVLFNPNALAVSQNVRDSLDVFSELEFLEVDIAHCGTYFIVHVITAIELPPDTTCRLAPAPSGNLVEIMAFPDTFLSPPGFFRVLQPIGSAARRLGMTTRKIYAGGAAKQAVEQAAGKYFEAFPR